MNEVFNEKQIKEIVKCLKRKKENINTYIKLMNSNNIDDIYIKDYIKYYTMYRSKSLNNENYYNVYFNYLKELKNNKKTIDFEEVLRYLINNTTANFISPSYASKLLATINPYRAVWDNNVLIQLDEELVQEYKKAKGKYYHSKKTNIDLNNYINKLVEIYNKIENTIEKKYLENNLGKALIEIFDNTYPEFYEITPIKKIDLVLWSLGTKKFMFDNIDKKM